MRTLLCLFTGLLLSGCEIEDEPANAIEPNRRAVDLGWMTQVVYVVRIDKCQYLSQPTGSGWGYMIHKGDCDNSAHRKEVAE